MGGAIGNESLALLIPARAPVSYHGGTLQFGRAAYLRIGGVAYQGALLIVSKGVYSLPVTPDDHVVLNFLDQNRGFTGDFVLIGTGAALLWPSATLRDGLDARGLGFEAMDTSAACRTYNILLAEARLFTAMLIA